MRKTYEKIYLPDKIKRNVYKETLTGVNDASIQKISFIKTIVDPLSSSLGDLQKNIEELRKSVESNKEITVKNPEKVTFPDIQKVKVTNEQKPIEFPKVQKVEITNPIKKMSVTVENLPEQKPIEFPDTQKVELKGLEKVLKSFNLPVNYGNNPKTANPNIYIPVRLTDGDRFYKALDEFYVVANNTNNSSTSSVITQYDILLDDYTTTNVTYVGRGKIGLSPSQGFWQISKIDETTGLILTWANGNSNFTNIWNNRASFIYS